MHNFENGQIYFKNLALSYNTMILKLDFIYLLFHFYLLILSDIAATFLTYG